MNAKGTYACPPIASIELEELDMPQMTTSKGFPKTLQNRMLQMLLALVPNTSARMKPTRNTTRKKGMTNALAPTKLQSVAMRLSTKFENAKTKMWSAVTMILSRDHLAHIK